MIDDDRVHALPEEYAKRLRGIGRAQQPPAGTRGDHRDEPRLRGLLVNQQQHPRRVPGHPALRPTL